MQLCGGVGQRATDVHTCTYMYMYVITVSISRPKIELLIAECSLVNNHQSNSSLNLQRFGFFQCKY